MHVSGRGPRCVCGRERERGGGEGRITDRRERGRRVRRRGQTTKVISIVNLGQAEFSGESKHGLGAFLHPILVSWFGHFTDSASTPCVRPFPLLLSRLGRSKKPSIDLGTKDRPPFSLVSSPTKSTAAQPAVPKVVVSG